MSSRFPVLHNRPIDQWRVTELKEELRRRGYPIKGLKEELVRRLDEAIRKEKEAEDAIDEEQVNQLNAISNPQDDCEKEGAVNPLAEDDTVTAVERNRNIVVDETTVETDKSTMDEDEDSKPQDGGGMFVADLVGAVENKSVVSVSGKSSSPRIDSCKQDSRSNEKSGYAEPLVEDVKLDERSGNSEPPVEDVKLNEQSEYSEPLGEKDKFIEDSKHSESPVEDLKLTEKNENPDPSVDVVECNLLEPNDEVSEVSFLEPPVEDVKPNLSEPNDQVSEVNLSEAPDDVKLNLSEPNDQVSEVSHALEFQVKCESISTDYVSINEKNELKDNFTANNFPLELEVVKPEMVQPSSSTCSPIGVDVHPFDGDKGPGDNQASLEEMDVKYTAEVNFSKKLDTMDGGSPEKLNLDRISGDESMDEDVLENKQMESQSALQVGEKSEASKVNDAEEQGVVDVVEGGFSADKKNIDEEMQPTAFTGKRALEAVEIKEPVKRQRRWNSETIKVPESQTSNIASPNTSKDTSQPTPRRIFARSDSTISGGSPKERTVPPAQKPATTSLRIDRFLRPFTLKAVRELLGKTGSVSDFWMDHIKTHCYATYSSVEEAIATRNAVYNLQWPPNGGRLLVAEFVDPQEVKARLEAPPQPAVITSPPSTAPAAPSLQQPQHPPSTPVQRGSRHQPPPPPPPTLPPPPPLPNPPPVREQLPPPPPLPKKPDPPVVTLDDLFKKTKATPRIYFLPLSEEQVAAKLGAQRKNVKE